MSTHTHTSHCGESERAGEATQTLVHPLAAHATQSRPIDKQRPPSIHLFLVRHLPRVLLRDCAQQSDGIHEGSVRWHDLRLCEGRGALLASVAGGAKGAIRADKDAQALPRAHGAHTHIQACRGKGVCSDTEQKEITLGDRGHRHKQRGMRKRGEGGARGAPLMTAPVPTIHLF